MNAIMYLSVGFIITRSVCMSEAADAVLDCRTFIPGLFDVPVYRADGVQRLSGESGCMAQLYIGMEPGSLSAIGPVLPFGTGDHAGYIWSDIPIEAVLPGVSSGSRIWVQLRAWEMHHGGAIPEDHPPKRFTGESEVFSLVVSDSPTALIGLESFSFDVPPLRIRHEGAQVVLRWDAGGGTVNYDVQQANDLSTSNPWHAAGLTPVLDVTSWSDGLGTTWFADWVVTNQTSQPTVFYRIELRDP